MSQQRKLTAEQERYIREHYASQSNASIAEAINIIGRRYNEAIRESLLAEAGSLSGIAKIRAERKARVMAVTIPFDSKSVMYYGAKFGLRKNPDIIGRPKSKVSHSDYITEGDSCTFFNGCYIDEVRNACIKEGKRFIYFREGEPMSVDAMKSAVNRYNNGDGILDGMNVSARYYPERNLMVLSATPFI